MHPRAPERMDKHQPRPRAAIDRTRTGERGTERDRPGARASDSGTGISFAPRSSQPRRAGRGLLGRYQHQARALPRSPSWLTELTDIPGVEFLWTSAFALTCITVGYQVLPGFIRMMGKSGRIETVEGALYVLLALAFPIAVAAAGWISARASAGRMMSMSVIAAMLVLFHAVWLFVALGAAAFLVSSLFALLVTTVARWRSTDGLSARDWKWIAVTFVILAGVWEAAFRLASWSDAAAWLTQSARTPIVLLIVTVAATVATVDDRPERGAATPRFNVSVADVAAVALFVALSFRTTPIIEFYHWSFWVGPIEAVRQGGWLLWDVPSQYGFLSVLLPAVIPAGDAWQSLYMVQGVLYFLTSAALYVSLASMRSGLVARLVAASFTATALFFRPRDLSLILPAQMTPAGGPMRFFWCYVILGVVMWKHLRQERMSDRRFAIIGTAVWLASVAWSAESGVYATATWGSAYTIFLIQRSFRRRANRKIREAARGIALPVTGLLAAIAGTSIVYVVFNGHSPDWLSYYEYPLLFSGGYSALPVEVRGVIWYLVAVFVVVSATVVRFLVREPSSSALMVSVAAWGTVWAISSYFVSRSHPVNLLSLVPLLIYSVAVVLHLLRSGSPDRWSQLTAMIAVPLIAMPIALTVAHARFPDLLLRRESAVSRLSAQVPAMDGSLFALVRAAGMRPGDRVSFVADGRYLMPRWPELEGGRAITSPLSWMPKPFEMISSLPSWRRDLYMARFHRRVGKCGWLVQKKFENDAAYAGVAAVIHQLCGPAETFENDRWEVTRFAAGGGGQPQPGKSLNF